MNGLRSIVACCGDLTTSLIFIYNKMYLFIKTYDISPNGANASFNCCVSISGLKSPTNMW